MTPRISLILFAAAAGVLLLGQAFPLNGATSPELDVTIWWWGTSTSDGFEPFIGWEPPPPDFDPTQGDRGDLAPFIGPTAVLAIALAVAGLVMAQQHRRGWAMGLAIALLATTLIGLGSLIDDLNGLPWRLCQEASPDGFGNECRVDYAAPGFGFIVVADILIGLALLSTIRWRHPEAPSELPALPDQHDS